MTRIDTYALACKALAHPRRVRIFQLLARDPAAGASLLALRQAMRLPQTSLAHHLDVMQSCGLLRRTRRGPVVSVDLTTFAMESAFQGLVRIASDSRRLVSHAA